MKILQLAEEATEVTNADLLAELEAINAEVAVLVNQVSEIIEWSGRSATFLLILATLGLIGVVLRRN